MGSVSTPWAALQRNPRWGHQGRNARTRALSGGEEAALEMFERIERFCGRIRIRPALGWLSPEEFEKKHMEKSRSKAA